MNDSEFKINEGTVTFSLDANKLKYNDSKTTPIFSIAPEGGSIFVVKDNDNKLKFFYVVLGKGRVDLEYDVSNLDPNIKYRFAFTWSLKDQKLVLYIDGKEKSSRDIIFTAGS